MKLVYTTLLAVALIVPACNRNETERVRAASGDRAANTEQMRHQRDEYVKAVDAKLAEFDQKLDGLEARAKGMSGAAKTEFQSSIDGLREQRKVVSKKLDDLKSVSLDSWLTLKGEVDAALADLEHSYEQVSSAHEQVPATAPKTH